MHQVTGFTVGGDLVLDDKHILSPDHAMLNYGYVTTSHASQGKTCGKVIISQSAMSFPAASLEQFYVSASRGKSAISIYTDDKHDLLEMARKSGQRLLATELSPMRKPEWSPLAAIVERTRHFKPVWNRVRSALRQQADALVGQLQRGIGRSHLGITR